MAQTSKLTLPTAADWKSQIISDIELAAIDAGLAIPPTAKGSDFDLKATALANGLAVLTANQVVLDNDNNPNTAEGDQLEEIRVADGLPEVPAKAATGKVRVTVTSLTPVTTVDGLGLIAPGALTAKLVGTTTGVVTGSELSFQMAKEGSAGNLRAGTVIRFTAPPSGLATEGVIVEDMSDGADVETDPKKRRRILNRRQNPPKSGNPSHLIDLALGATNAIDRAFVYPALGGPSTAKVSVSAPWYVDTSGQSRNVGSSAIAIISNVFEANLPTDDHLYVVESTLDEPVDLCISLTVLPGNSGWIDSTTWPEVRTYVSGVTSNTSFSVTMSSSSSMPLPGRNIAVWSVEHQAFRTSIILTSAYVSGNTYAITVAPWQGGPVTIAIGQFISPAAWNMFTWGDSLLEIMGNQTPGELCYSWQEPNALRIPVETQADPIGVGAREMNALVSSAEELADAAIVYANKTEPTRGTPGTQARVLTLRHLSFIEA